jgi:hypothetical protein
MAQEPCKQCEEHARLHSGNWGFGDQSEPCKQCEEHVILHREERKLRWW